MLSALRSVQPAQTLRRQPFKRHGVRCLSYTHVLWQEEAKPAALDKAVKTEKTEDKPLPIPPLSRPLGVPEVPTTREKTLAEKGKEILDHEKQMEKRRHLVKEASTGYFQDLHMTRFNGGKTWMAPSVLIREDKALYFPNIKGVRLDNGAAQHTTNLCHGKISVISMLTTKISEYHAESYTSRLNKMYGDHTSFQHVYINLQENILKSLLVNIFLTSLRSKVPQEQQANYLISRQNMEYVREQLGMVNSRIGYTYLVDDKLKVRWAACADAKPEEEEALVRGVGVLLKRFKNRPAAKTEAPLP
ncbi:hypothetical protein DENSPDRAFT_898178 [Dentipellis sp. KUC8613]|nr:hypothetical protein DENSPDRAFT_898178 [Dentipellis sp. KUC8613]